MRYAPWQKPRNIGGEAGFNPIEVDPGVGDPDYGPNQSQIANNERLKARIAALRANPMFRASSTPIKYKEGTQGPNVMDMMLGLQGQGQQLQAGNQLPAMFRPTRRY